MTMKVAVLGLGVGYALACCLAEAGYETIGIDINPGVVANPRKDRSVIRLLRDKNARKRIEKNLRLTTEIDTIGNCSFILVCVSTGDEKKLVLGHVADCVRQVLHVLRGSNLQFTPIIMEYSTLPFGSSRTIREIFMREHVEIDKEVGYVHFPLMIAQGTTAEDFVNPPFVVFGSYSPSVGDRA
jgi:UDP-N-acetyl-D-mannosaminuronate dehydrogenase